MNRTQHDTIESQTKQHTNTQQGALDKDTYIHPPIKAVTFTTRGMHNTILDLHHLLNTQTKATIIHLTEAKHIHIKSMWKEALKEYKAIHAFPKLEPITNRRSGGTILAARRDTYKEANAITPPTHLRDYISAATITPHDGSITIAISAYMPHLHTKAQETIYTEFVTWIHTYII